MTELSTDRRFHNLTKEQVQTLDQVLTEVIPIHGRGNFPTLEVKPKDIIHVVRNRLMEKEIKVRDVRLNGSTASHVLVKENGTSYKDLDIIFGVELPKQEDFQIIKEVVLGCLLDFLPRGVNKDKITALTMKEAYVQKMVKVFTEHDRWSLISLSNNSGKNVELKFVNSLRRQFEFSVDSFQIILDRMLESYLEAERRQVAQCKKLESEASAAQSTKPLESPTEELPSTSLVLTNSPNADVLGEVGDVADYGGSPCCQKDVVMQEEELPSATEETVVEAVDQMEVVEMDEPAPDPETEEGADLTKLEVEEKGVSDLETETDTSDFETQAQAVEQFLKPKTDTEDLKNPMDIINDLTSPVEKTPAKTPVALKVPYKTKFQSCAQETQDSYIEFPLPPPAKKTYKKSQMVILKHSSPKPPRKMSKKMTSGPLSLARAPSVNELLFPASQPLDPATIIPKESMPISDEVSGPASSESAISASRDIVKRQVKRPDVPTAPQSVEIQNCDAKSQAQPTSLQCLTDDLQTTGPDVLPQSAEHTVPECGDDVQNIQEQVSSFEVPFPLPQLPDPASQTVHLTQVPEHGAQEQEVQIHAAQVPELADQPPESLTHDPELITLLPEFGVQEPEVATQGPDVCNQAPEPTAHILKPAVPEAQSESASTTEASETPRDLPAITVVAESMYGDFEQAMDHLRYRLIATRNPEEIRGGGLLKYSNLLVREFKPASETEIKTLERYMCSRFFIDFPDVNEQQRKIESYLRNHFIGEEKSKYDYLMTLRRVVNESTVCLMGHERRQTLNMITILALKVLGEQNIIPNTTNVTCYYQPAPYMADHNFSNYYIAHGQPPLIYHPYPMHIHMQTGLV